jgi:hypothetical protein
MRYANLLIVFLGCLYLTLSSLFPRRNRRDWRQRATAVSGILGMFYAGLSLFGMRYVEEPQTQCIAGFFVTKGLLGGVSSGILLSLWMEGSLNLFKLLRRQTRTETDLKETHTAVSPLG